MLVVIAIIALLRRCVASLETRRSTAVGRRVASPILHQIGLGMNMLRMITMNRIRNPAGISTGTTIDRRQRQGELMEQVNRQVETRMRLMSQM